MKTEAPKIEATSAPAVSTEPAATTPPAATDATEATPAPAVDAGETKKLPTTELASPAPITTEEILLGAPELLAGVPGAGPLTQEQLQKWLDDPKNHVIIKPILPLGLAAAVSQIVGLDVNPLTRARITDAPFHTVAALSDKIERSYRD